MDSCDATATLGLLNSSSSTDEIRNAIFFGRYRYLLQPEYLWELDYRKLAAHRIRIWLWTRPILRKKRDWDSIHWDIKMNPYTKGPAMEQWIDEIPCEFPN